MKSAFLLAKDGDLYHALANVLRGLGYPLSEADLSICLNPDEDCRFMLYARGGDLSFFERHEIPDHAFRAGYIYGYYVECRSERLFCDVVQAIPSAIDIMVCDSDGNVFERDELSPDTLCL